MTATDSDDDAVKADVEGAGQMLGSLCSPMLLMATEAVGKRTWCKP
jgi:hypothetical protein